MSLNDDDDTSWIDKVPGMKAGHRKRNWVLGVFYVFLLMGIMGSGGGDTASDTTASADAVTETPVSEATATETADPATTTPTATATPTPSPTATPVSIGPSHFETVLAEQYNADVVSYEETGDTGELTVTSHSFGSTDALATEMGQVAGTYAAYVDSAEDPPAKLEVTVLEADGETVAGTYTVQTEWAVAYNDGEITAEQYSTRVMQTIEVADE